MLAGSPDAHAVLRRPLTTRLRSIEAATSTIRRVNATTVLGSIGAGNMAGAMVEGWLRADPAAAERILVTDRGSGRAARLAERLGVQHVADNAELVRRADVVLIAVKPIDVERVLREASELIETDTAIVSVAAGVATTTLENVLEQGVPLFRCMPNVGVKVGSGTLCFASGPFTGSDAEARVLGWLGQLGTVVTLEERLFDAATALAGSGPAFLGLVIEAFEDAGITSGLSASTARALILSTMVGTANVLDETGISCSDLRRMVTSPGGTAAAGLAQMERASVRGGIIDGVLAALARAGQLG
ncbi:MAG: pyrroline-5-carboxylate reductase [Gaiellales bacterium]|nr:pyrroline-5-carboxylate reductase [Gaiellales bacterium]